MQPQYIQIAEQLRHQIASGEYPIGSKIPTEINWHNLLE